MSDFIKNPSKEELIENLEVATRIENYKASGYDVFTKNGQFFYTDNDGMQQYVGTLPNLSETTRDLFGDTIPEGVEYITIDDITMMTYQGAVIACGYVDKNFEGYYTFNSVINSEVAGVIGGTADILIDKPVYETGSTLAAALEAIFRSTDTTANYDNIIGQLANLMNFTDGTPWAGEVVDEYIEVMSLAGGKKLIEVILAESQIYDCAVLECARKKDSNVKIEWLEGSGGEDGSLITMNEIFEDFSDVLAEAYPDLRGELKKYLDEATLAALDELYGYYGEASSAVVDPLVFDIGNDGFDINPLAVGSYFDMDGDGIAEKVNWTTKDAFLALDVNGDGIINDAGELFGDQTYLASGKKARDGFEALARYDANGDGVINADGEGNKNMMTQPFRPSTIWIWEKKERLAGHGVLFF